MFLPEGWMNATLSLPNCTKQYPTAKPKRDGNLSLFMPESQNSFRIRADYREGAQEVSRKRKRKGN